MIFAIDFDGTIFSEAWPGEEADRADGSKSKKD